jgi:NAD+ dependent glucose-6-phosphate dehydrogenase
MDTTVLVTGATGYMAARFLPGLRGRYELRLVDARTGPDEGAPPEPVEVVDLTQEDRGALAHLFEGVDVVVHLAYRRSAPNGVYDPSVPQIDRFEDEFANLRMAQNVYRCAFDAGVRRVIVASSNHAADWYEHTHIHAGLRESVDPLELPLSDNFYGWSKAAYEHLGFLYACGGFGRQLEVVQLRIGAPRDIDATTYAADEPPPPVPGPRYPTGLARYKRDLGAWLSERDGQQLLRRAIDTEDITDADGVPWAVVYGISGNTRAFWSLASARTILGYRPEDDSEVVYAEDIRRLLTGPNATVGGGRVGT